jgi:hypothetical protein
VDELFEDSVNYLTSFGITPTMQEIELLMQERFAEFGELFENAAENSITNYLREIVA